MDLFARSTHTHDTYALCQKIRCNSMYSVQNVYIHVCVKQCHDSTLYVMSDLHMYVCRYVRRYMQYA